MERKHGGQSMAARLRRVLICPPAAAGWADSARAARWRELGYSHPPDGTAAGRQHARLVRILEDAGAEILSLPPHDSHTPDAVYVRDPSFMTDQGAVILRMRKPARVDEPARHEAFYASQGIPVLGRIEPPGTVEGGDLFWLDSRTLLAGHSYRTNAAGIAQLAGLLGPHGVQVIEAPLPHGRGPETCMHIMSLISMIGERKLLVDLERLSVPTVALLRRMELDLVGIDPAERDTFACNVLCLGEGRLAAIEENRSTNRKLREAGCDVEVFPGSEICHNGGGGPTCLTRPLLRG